MSDLFTYAHENTQSDQQRRALSVTELTQQIKSLFEDQFSVVWVQGEISNFKAHGSGHFYFNLKDKQSQINAIMFKGNNRHLKFRLEDGLEVMVRGRVSVYEPRGSYQIYCEQMEPVGLGALQKAFEQLKEKLKSEGLFDQDRKKTIPEFPQHIAIVTSKTGAAVRDILNVIGRRFRSCQITIVPTLVQGEGAAKQIVESLKLIERMDSIDVVILSRGGGSIEDLWPFNEEVVARQIADCSKPIISAIGHEVDFTIADFVADLRAPTPSAAAELVVKNTTEVMEKIRWFSQQLLSTWNQQINLRIQRVDSLMKRLADPQKKIQDLLLRVDEKRQRLIYVLNQNLNRNKQKIEALRCRLIDPQKKLIEIKKRVYEKNHQLKLGFHNVLVSKKNALKHFMLLLDSFSPLKVVDRGYSIVRRQGEVIKSLDQVKVNDSLEVTLSKGALLVKVTETQSKRKI